LSLVGSRRKEKAARPSRAAGSWLLAAALAAGLAALEPALLALGEVIAFALEFRLDFELRAAALEPSQHLFDGLAILAQNAGVFDRTCKAGALAPLAFFLGRFSAPRAGRPAARALGGGFLWRRRLFVRCRARLGEPFSLLFGGGDGAVVVRISRGSSFLRGQSLSPLFLSQRKL
jgi:hypothetical protein